MNPWAPQNVTQRVVEILDAKYEKADLQAVVDATGPHLSLQDQNMLRELLIEYEELFDETLGDWDTEVCAILCDCREIHLFILGD